ncbi:MAG: hypothetical protein K2I18_08155 [Paramuribaculum sp.]|nr:hypothetical protein [Paramuribaculum sp.]
MARSINDIKNEITSEFMRNEAASKLYGFEPGTSFGDKFGAASIENILFYVWAVCAWSVEQLVNLHKKEVTEELENLIAHRPKWYRDKVLAFMFDKSLVDGTDTYDTSGMEDTQIVACKVVRHATATESKDASLLTIKVAGENGGNRCPLTYEQEEKLKAYIAEIKDAGVRVNLINQSADEFSCAIDVYYDDLLLPGNVESSCRSVISEYVENLPFNGEYTNMALVDRLQQVEGVKIIELKESKVHVDGESAYTSVDARIIPAAGYFKTKDIDIKMIPYNGE